MSLTPTQFERQLVEIRDLTRRLGHEYRWVHGSAHARTVSDEEKVTVTSSSDPTGSLVAARDKTRQRREMVRATREVAAALLALEKAAAALRIASARDPGGVRFQALRYPITVMRSELKESREAKLRREERGEGIPE